GALLVGVATAVAARQAWALTAADGVALGLVALGVRAVGVAVMRSRLVALGARAQGLRAAPWGRPVALLGAQLVVWAAAALVGGGLGGPLVALGAFVALHGWFTTGAAVGTFGLLLGTGAALAVRALGAFAPAEVVVARRSAVSALSRSVRAVAPQIVPVAFLVLCGDLAIGLGALACGAGALPGYPITDLAVLHRWRGSATSGMSEVR
ncbi:MAG: hypothetical protein R3F59_39370, partial [Myxococcota bacterium]